MLVVLYSFSPADNKAAGTKFFERLDSIVKGRWVTQQDENPAAANIQKASRRVRNPQAFLINHDWSGSHLYYGNLWPLGALE